MKGINANIFISVPTNETEKSTLGFINYHTCNITEYSTDTCKGLFKRHCRCPVCNVLCILARLHLEKCHKKGEPSSLKFLDLSKKYERNECKFIKLRSTRKL